jgi:hypothetical protein
MPGENVNTKGLERAERGLKEGDEGLTKAGKSFFTYALAIIAFCCLLLAFFQPSEGRRFHESC